jgi:hypothetical protein
MSFAGRFRRAVVNLGQALGGRRPGVELVRVDRPELLTPPRPLPALPAPHPRPRRRGGGLSQAYGRSIVPDPSRPRPLGQGPAHDRAVYRDSVSPWRVGGPAPPPPSGLLDELREELYAPRIPWWEQREQRDD